MPVNVCPSPRQHASATLVEGCLFLYGGENGDLQNDMYVRWMPQEPENVDLSHIPRRPCVRESEDGNAACGENTASGSRFRLFLNKREG